jgi:hypothetical protein
MRTTRALSVVAVPAVLFVLSSCSGGDHSADPDASADTDADADTDSDTDADTDTDSDTDADTDTDADAGADTDSDTVSATSCPVHVDGSLGAYAGHDGSTWALAYRTVQEGLDGAAAGCEVWVAAGTYEPIELRAGVAVYGGFAGTETSLEGRDWETNVTTLDGGGIAPAVVGADFARIDGFTITGGAEAGMVNEIASPFVSHCRFSSNAGSGMHNGLADGVPAAVYASPVVSQCAFSGNTGCGIANTYANATVTDCVFEGNGCGISSSAEDWQMFTTKVARTVFSYNTGAGIRQDYGCEATVTSCMFQGNGDGAIKNVSFASAEVNDSVFLGNAAVSGGAISNVESSSEISGCTFVGNAATVNGGAIYDGFGGYAVVSNCVFWGNTAPSGSAIFNDPEYGSNSGSSHVTYSDVQGGCTVASDCTTDETGNIDADPLFANDDADAGVIDLHLQPGSPCIDTGLSSALPAELTTDLDGNPRVVGAAVDMGAYEFQP